MKNEISNILSLINSGDSLKALQEAKSFYNKNENNIDAVKVLAYTYIQIGNFERVIEVLKRGYSKRNDQMDFDYFNNMGYALSQIEEFEESITYLKKASELNNSPSADICLAEVFLKQRKFKDSKEVILIALDKIKKIGVESFSKFANVFLLISEINGALKQDEETIELFIQILKERFNENIFFLLCNISPGHIEKEIINKAESYLLINEDSFKNKIERFNYVTPLYFGLAMYYQSKVIEKSEAFFDNGN